MEKKYAFIALSLSLLTASCGDPPREAVSPVEAKNSPPKGPQPEPGTAFDQQHRWDLTDPIAVQALSNTPFGEQEIVEYWTRKGWRNTKKEDSYNAAIEQLLADQRIKKTTHWSMTPFTPVYKANEQISIQGVSIPGGTEFWMETNENEDDIKLGHPLFTRATGYQEEHQGHVDQASDGRDGELRAGRERH
jgi:hypothetical protein